MTKLNENTTGFRIRKARLSIPLKQKEFAKLINVTPNYLGLAERGQKHPSKNLLAKIANVTQKNYEWLLTGKEPENQTSKEPEDQTSNVTIPTGYIMIPIPDTGVDMNTIRKTLKMLYDLIPPNHTTNPYFSPHT